MRHHNLNGQTWIVLLCLGLVGTGCPVYTDYFGPDPVGDDDTTGDDDASDDDATDDDDTTDDDDATDDDDTTDDDDDDTHPPHTSAMLSATDFFSAGQLASVDLDSHAVATGLADASTDSWLAYGEGLLVQLDGFGVDTIWGWDPDVLSNPTWVVTAENGANPRDAAVFGGEVFVVQYGIPEILVLDAADGAELDTIDTSTYADTDGNPECHTIQLRAGHLWVSCLRLDATYQPAPEGGLLLRIDPANHVVLDIENTDSALTCHAFDGRNDLVCHQGVDVDVDWVNVYEGGLFTYDVATGTFGPDLFQEALLAANISIYGFGEGDVGLIAAAGDANGTLLCADMGTGSTNVVEADLGWIVAIEVNDRNEAYVLNRSSWASPYAGPFGVSVYDLATCDLLSAGILDTGLEPYQATFLY